MTTLRIVVFGLCAWASNGVAAQDTSRVSIYRFILGVDVPVAPAFVALGVAPTHVLRGSAPKPLAASTFAEFSGEATQTGVAVGAAPYFLAGGGVQTLPSYRSRSIGGRLLRVLTKTVASVGAVRVHTDPSATLVGVAVRSTFHDPHDPALNSSLPEDVAALLDGSGVSPVAASEEDVTDHGVDLAPPYARARRAMRARTGGGDPQVSGGWGMAGRLRGGAVDRDSLGTLHHTFWLSAQVTKGRLIDLLGTVHLRDAFREEHVWVGAALLRKTAALDLTAEVYYDTATRGVYPGVALDARLLANLGLTAALTTRAATDPLARAGPRALAALATVQWFYASDR